MKIIMIIVMFLLIGAFFIISEENLALQNSENMEKFMVGYGDWIDNVVTGVGGVTGYVLKMKWLPGGE